MPTANNSDAHAAVRQAIKLAEVPGRIVNAYETAGKILKTLPKLDLELEDVVDMMIEMPGSVSAFEFSPPAAVVEIILPGDSRSPAQVESAQTIDPRPE
jgi:hypothetical protein